MTWARDDHMVSDEHACLDLEAVHAHLAQSYRSPGVPLEVAKRAAAGSVPFGLYREAAVLPNT